MNLIDWLYSRFGTKTQPIANPPAWLVAEGVGEQYSIPDRQLPEAQLELYQRLSWVQIAVHQVAQAAAVANFGVMKLEGEKRRKIENHPFELLLNRPNPLQDQFEFTYATIANYALTGNCYWWLNRANENAPVDELWLLPPHKVRPVPDKRMFLKGYVFEAEQDKPVTLELHEVVHFKRYHPLNPFIGLSPIESLAITASADMNMQRFGSNYFDKGYAKPQGALAFSDPMQDFEWQRIKKDIKDNHGGTKREMLMLRGVGQGGVSWVQMGLSQKDMEFLESRTFNKEEIFAMFAPGLSSMLAVNATEANSIAGKKTFTELGVWPYLVAVAKKTTNDVLPAYGEKLIAEFDDIRITDRAMELQEQQAFSAVHTVDEVRERFYEAEPIGDDRGKLLIAEVGKGLTNAKEPPPPPTPEQQIALAQANRPPVAAPGNDKPQTEGQPEADDPGEEARDEEAKRFRKWLKKRPNVDPTRFESDILSDAELVAIAAQLKTEVEAGQPFFTTVGKAIRKLPGEDGDDEKRSELEKYHADKIHAALRKLLRAVAPAGTTVENITPDSAWQRYKDNDRVLRDAIIEMLMDGAQLGADTGIAQVEAILGVGKSEHLKLPEIVLGNDSESLKATITGVNWDLVNEAVLQWVLGTTGGGFGTGYADETLVALAQTGETQIRSHIAAWVNNGLPYNVLLDNLERTVFSRNRAELLAITETTRAYATGNRLSWQRSNVIRQMRFNNSADERVCPICSPLGGRIVDVNGDFDGQMPPVHPRCRCWLSPVPLAKLPEQIRPVLQPTPAPPTVAVQPEAPRNHRDLAAEGVNTEKWAKTGYKEYYKTLSAADKKAIKQYSSNDYEAINPELRKGKVPPKYAEMVSAVDSALARSAIPEDVSLFRGVYNTTAFKKLKPGDSFTDASFVSTSLDKNAISNFVNEKDPLVMKILAKKGQKGAGIAPLSEFKEEGELLLPRGQTYRVVGLSTDTVERTFFGRKQQIKVKVVELEIVG